MNDDNRLTTPLLEGRNEKDTVDAVVEGNLRREQRPSSTATLGSISALQHLDTMCQASSLATTTTQAEDGLFRGREQHQGGEETEQSSWDVQQVSAMLSNFSTSYNVVNISLVLPILESISFSSSSSLQSEILTSSALHQDAVAAVASSLLAGMMVGQIAGGALGDLLGAANALRLVMSIQIGASLGSAVLCRASVSSPNQIYWQLAAWRLVLGIGAGGVYPLAAVLSAGDSATKRSGGSLQRVVWTFSTQGLGFVTVPIVTTVLLYTVHGNLNLVWRVILGLGCLPGIALMIVQCHATQQHRAHSAVPQDEDQEEERIASDEENESILDSLPDPVTGSAVDDGTGSLQEIHQRRSWWDAVRREENLVRKLLGTAATWFLFDVLFYGNTLFQPIVMEAAFGAKSSHGDPVHVLRQTTIESLALTSIALPGYFVAGLLLGKKRSWCYCGIEQTARFVMLQGFAAMAILYLIIGGTWKELRRHPTLLVLLYGSTFFFANYGPNTTTFVLPSLVFSPECRSTFNGLSAAAGKLGALTGASLFEPAAEALGDASVMILCAIIAVMALAITKLFVPHLVDSDNSEGEADQMPVPVHTTEENAVTAESTAVV
jgi:MFS transporter, PHS family, inorganic phosphate transporter